MLEIDSEGFRNDEAPLALLADDASGRQLDHTVCFTCSAVPTTTPKAVSRRKATRLSEPNLWLILACLLFALIDGALVAYWWEYGQLKQDFEKARVKFAQTTGN